MTRPLVVAVVVGALCLAPAARAGCELAHWRTPGYGDVTSPAGFELLTRAAAESSTGQAPDAPAPLPACSGPQCRNQTPAPPLPEESRSAVGGLKHATLSGTPFQPIPSPCASALDEPLVRPLHMGPAVYHPPR